MTYRTDGSKNSDAAIFSEIKDHSEEMASEYADSGSPAGAIVGVILVLIGGGVGFYVYKKRKHGVPLWPPNLKFGS